MAEPNLNYLMPRGLSPSHTSGSSEGFGFQVQWNRGLKWHHQDSVLSYSLCLILSLYKCLSVPFSLQVCAIPPLGFLSEPLLYELA